MIKHGTKLSQSDVQFLCVPLPYFLRNTNSFAALRAVLITRFCKKIAKRFDLMISAYNPIDFGTRGIQRIGDFSFDDRIREEMYQTSKPSLLHKAYRKFCAFLTTQNFKKNLTIVNSVWSAQLMKKAYGIQPYIVYSPVATTFSSIPFLKRKKDFVFLGRISPEKKIEKIIAILERVRALGHDVKLHIAGALGNTAYARTIRHLQQQRKNWISFEGFVRGKKKERLLSQNRFGINACPGETFGVSIAEMAKAGCVVFVPNSGGQTEIVKDQRLIYKDNQDAVEKIDRVLKNEAEQKKLSEQLRKHSQKFSVKLFKQQIRKVVKDFLSQTR